MFCKWCGNKITNNGMPCPTCGKGQDALVNGNGFWDLCEVEPKGGKQGAVPLATVESPNVNDERHPQTKRSDHQKAKKAAKKSGNGIVILMCALCLMVAACLIESSIALNKASKCIDEMASIKTQISGLRTDVSNGVSEIKEYIDTAITPTVIQAPEEVEENANDDLNELLNSENAANIVDGVISVESHEIESDKADTVLIVSGYPVEDENARLIWQQYNEQTEEWITIAENQDYILLKENDDLNQIRVLYISQNELEEYTVYGANYAMKDDSYAEDDADSESDEEGSDHTYQEQSVGVE